MHVSYITALIITKQIFKYGIGQLLILCRVYGYYLELSWWWHCVYSCNDCWFWTPPNHQFL